MSKLILGSLRYPLSGLKPCPFCGEAPIVQRDVRYPRPRRTAKQAWEIICDNPECIIFDADTRYFLRCSDAIAAWNTRASEASAPTE